MRKIYSERAKVYVRRGKSLVWIINMADKRVLNSVRDHTSVLTLRLMHHPDSEKVWGFFCTLTRR